MICLRCGREFDNSVPEVTVPDGRRDIATSEWCAECNAFAMNILLRWASAYKVEHPFDPVRGGK